MSPSPHIEGIIKNLPESPGVYQYLNSDGTIIYVGKAKNLKRRVNSYFNKEHESFKTRMLVSNIADLHYIVVQSEQDAFLLENMARATPVSASAKSLTRVSLRRDKSTSRPANTTVRTPSATPWTWCSKSSTGFILYAPAACASQKIRQLQER